MVALTYILPKDILNQDIVLPKNQVGFRGLARFLYPALERAFGEVGLITSLKIRPSLPGLLRLGTGKLLKKETFWWTDPAITHSYARQIEKKAAATKSDVLLSTEFKLVAEFHGSTPLALWQDACYSQMIGMYPWGRGLSPEAIEYYRGLDQQVMQRASFVVFPTRWSADFAVENFEVDPAKVHVIPYGGNLETRRDSATVDSYISGRQTGRCELLLVGTDWERKGGPRSAEIARRLNERGIPARLNVIGCEPQLAPMPDYVNCVGFLDKNTPEGIAALDGYFAGAHFLMLFSTADIFPHVICEAASYGVPCIGARTGGIPTAVAEGVSGKTYALDAPVETICDDIAELWNEPQRYGAMARAAFSAFESQLNWDAAAHSLKDLLS